MLVDEDDPGHVGTRLGREPVSASRCKEYRWKLGKYNSGIFRVRFDSFTIDTLNINPTYIMLV
jgi:hypothetical protein